MVKKVENPEILSQVANALAIEVAKISMSRVEQNVNENGGYNTGNTDSNPVTIAQSLFFAFLTARQELRGLVQGAKGIIIEPLD